MPVRYPRIEFNCPLFLQWHYHTHFIGMTILQYCFHEVIVSEKNYDYFVLWTEFDSALFHMWHCHTYHIILHTIGMTNLHVIY